jgi:hypothetical protein
MYAVSASAVLPVLVTATPRCRSRGQMPRSPVPVRPWPPATSRAGRDLSAYTLYNASRPKKVHKTEQKGERYPPRWTRRPDSARSPPGGAGATRAAPCRGWLAQAGQPTGAATSRPPLRPGVRSHPPRARRPAVHPAWYWPPVHPGAVQARRSRCVDRMDVRPGPPGGAGEQHPVLAGGGHRLIARSTASSPRITPMAAAHAIRCPSSPVSLLRQA